MQPWFTVYSTTQKKPNRERERDRVQNGYRTGMRRRTQQVQNGYRMDIEWIRNGNGSKKRKKRSGMQTIRERVLQNTW